MKKFLVIALAAMFVLGLSLMTSAAIKWTGGEVQAEYDFESDEMGTKIELSLEGKVSDKVTAYVELEADWGKFEEEDDNGDVVELDSSLVLDEAYFIAKTGFGKIYVGSWEEGLYANYVIDEGDGDTFGDVIAGASLG